MAKFKNNRFTLNHKVYEESEPGKGIEIPDEALPKKEGSSSEVDLQRCKRIGLKLTEEMEKKLQDDNVKKLPVTADTNKSSLSTVKDKDGE